MRSDHELLQEFVGHASEEAFRELVERHINHVFSAAVRRLGGDCRMAEDAAQETFVALAKHAREIRNGDSIGAWLHRHVCFLTANIVRTEQRRKHREAAAAQIMNTEKDSRDWNQIAPALDETINQLPERDRHAILLRYFGQRDLKAVGQILGVSEDAAQKRISRAIEKLQVLFAKKGITISASAFASLLYTKCVIAAPSGLAAAATGAALARAAWILSTNAAVGAVFGLKLKTAVAAIALIGVAGVLPIAYQHYANTRLERENASLREEIESLLSAPAQAAQFDAVTTAAAPADASPNREILHLRAQVSVLRAELASRTNAPRGIRILSEGDFSAPFQPTMDPEDIRQILTFDSLHDAGSKTPEAAVQTFLWARRLTMDPTTFDAGNERVKQIAYQPPGSKYGGLARNTVHDPFRDSKLLKIEAVTYPTADTAKVIVNYYNDLGYQSGITQSLIRVGDEWQIDLGIGTH